jgi:hypothetical protein
VAVQAGYGGPGAPAAPADVSAHTLTHAGRRVGANPAHPLITNPDCATSPPDIRYAVALGLHATLVAKPASVATAREGWSEFDAEMARLEKEKRDIVVQRCAALLRDSTGGRIILTTKGTQGRSTSRRSDESTPLLNVPLNVPTSAPSSSVNVLDAIHTNDVVLLGVLREIQISTPERIVWRSTGDKKLPEELLSTIPITHVDALRLAVELGASATGVGTYKVKTTATACCTFVLYLVVAAAKVPVWVVERVLRVSLVLIPLINLAFRCFWMGRTPPDGYVASFVAGLPRSCTFVPLLCIASFHVYYSPTTQGHDVRTRYLVCIRMQVWSRCLESWDNMHVLGFVWGS